MQMLLQHSFSLPLRYFIHNTMPLRNPSAYKFGHAKCSLATTQTSQVSHHDHVKNRQSAVYKPSIWSYDFVQSLNIDHNQEEVYKDGWKLPEEYVKHLIDHHDDDYSRESSVQLTTLELIDDIQRLGLGHHFEEDITRALDRMKINELLSTDQSLHLTALSFRLLRQHGFEVSQDVFKRFTDAKGNFKACLSKDVKGVLSLYEASNYCFEGESLLDEALAFSRKSLTNFVSRSDVTKAVAEQVSHALELPLHRRMQRLEARWYIESYSNRADADPLLLELAKRDFNRVQYTLQKDLQDVYRWWIDMGLAQNLSFTRDRLMECLFWSVGMISEPQFSDLRKGLTKVAALVTTIDDVYDVYGTTDELELFTSAVERWDVNYALAVLPDYMKLCFLALYNTVNELVYDTLKEQGENVLPYVTKAWADLCKAFLKEKKWSHNKHTPPFEEYIDNAWISVSGVVLFVHTYFLLKQKITKQALEGLENHHNLVHRPSLIFRLCNDLSTSAAEVERGENANSISCMMRGSLISEECARKYTRNLVDNSWKKLNEDGASTSPFTKEFVKVATNVARIAQCIYQYGDGHGDPDTRAKNRILSVIVDPV